MKSCILRFGLKKNWSTNSRFHSKKYSARRTNSRLTRPVKSTTFMHLLSRRRRLQKPRAKGSRKKRRFHFTACSFTFWLTPRYSSSTPPETSEEVRTSKVIFCTCVEREKVREGGFHPDMIDRKLKKMIPLSLNQQSQKKERRRWRFFFYSLFIESRTKKLVNEYLSIL